MKIRYFLSLFFASTLLCGAQDKIDIPGKLLLQDYHAIRNGGMVLNPDIRLVGSLSASPMTMSRAASDATNIGHNLIGAVITMSDDCSAYDMSFGDIADVQEVISDRVVTVVTTVDGLERLMEMPEVQLVSIGDRNKTFMNNARSISGVDPVHAGTAAGLTKAYKGSGVIVGMFDTGMDPNHINFKKADNLEQSRVKLVLKYTGSYAGTPNGVYDTPEAIAGFTTDKTTEDHGTHVMGIISGAYNGEGEWMNGVSRVQGDAMPYYGVAPEADIVMAGGDLYDANILNGVKRIFDYADAQNKPAVVNLSLGTILNPHDGTTGASVGLEELGKRGIICVAAGNDGGNACAFTIDGAIGLKQQYMKYQTVGFPAYTSGDTHRIEVYHNTTSPFTKFELMLFNASGSVVWQREITSAGASLGTSGAGSGYETVSEFDEGFESGSWIRVTPNVNTNMYSFIIQHRMKANATEPYRLAIRVTRTGNDDKAWGIHGQSAFTDHGYGGKTYKDINNVQSWWLNSTKINADGSISSMATGKNILVVGAYSASGDPNYLLYSNGSYWPADGAAGEIASFSSWGKNWMTNEYFPHVCAPGVNVISSENSHYSTANTRRQNASAAASYGSDVYYWRSMSGTSMATPFTTGTVALWLEANPGLTIEDVKNIVKKTSDSSGSRATSNNQWGAGKVNALEGLKEALVTITAIDGVFADDDKRFILQQSPSSLDVFVAGAESINASLYSIAGQQISASRVADSSLTLSTESLAKGIYILKVDTPVGSFNRKVAIR